MNKPKSIFSILIALLIIAQGSIVKAEEIDYQAMAKTMVEAYESAETHKEEIAKEDERFVNEMAMEQEKKKENMEKIFKKSKEKGEKFYSYDQLLKIKAEKIGIDEKDLETIKGQVLAHKTELENLLQGFEETGNKNHSIAKNLKKELSLKIPESQIFIDHSFEPQDGQISGGGWPYCLDDNGYGYQNFITSDCYKAIIGYLICASDSTLGKMNSNLRYCKAYVKNCSPLIGHSKSWHTHDWWQKIP